MSAGQHADAYDDAPPLFDPADPAFHLTERFHGVMYLAEAAAHAGRSEDARRGHRALEARRAATPAPTLHLHLSYARAVLADDDQAEELFLRRCAADLIRWPWLRARLELAYGQWLRRQRRVAQARPPLRSALSHLRPDRRGRLGRAGQDRAARRRRARRGPGSRHRRDDAAVRAGTADRPARR